jgi:hypothetical protein
VNGRDATGLDLGPSCADFDGYAFIENGVEVKCTQDRVDALNGWFHGHYGFGLDDAILGTIVPQPGLTAGCTFGGIGIGCTPGAYFQHGGTTTCSFGMFAPAHACDDFAFITGLLYHSTNKYDDRGGMCSSLGVAAQYRMEAGWYTYGGSLGYVAGYAPPGTPEVVIYHAGMLSIMDFKSTIVHEEVHKAGIVGTAAYAAESRCP